MIFSAIEFLVGVSAVTGGIRLITTNGMGLPLSWLINTPFDSYFWPGVILASVVGGTYLLASITMWQQTKYYLEMSCIAGFGLLIWIFTELYLLPEHNPLQIIYFGIGIATIVLAILLLREKLRLKDTL